jgi:magnesium transporter
VPAAEEDTPLISVFAWNDSTKKGTWGGANDLPPRDALPDVLWIDLEEPTVEEEKLVLDKFFHVHSLTLEDVQRPRRQPNDPPHFPKVEEFPDYLFVVVNPLSLLCVENLTGAGQIGRCISQLSAVLTDHILITHHTEPLVSIAELHTFLNKHVSQASRGPDFLFHHILDVMVDHYAPLLDSVDSTLDDLEDEVFTRPGPQLLARLLRLKCQIIQFRKTMIYEREVLARMSRGEFDLINEREMVYYRNVYDHLIRFTELIEASREMVMDLMQTLLASQANKLNEIMKVLTMISVIILPMTLIAGVYGMNFENDTWWWPSLKNYHGVPIALGMMLLTALAALAFFKWMKWI